MPAGSERFTPFVGASLLANRGAQRAVLQASIRRQASSHKVKLPFALGESTLTHAASHLAGSLDQFNLVAVWVGDKGNHRAAAFDRAGLAGDLAAG